MQLVAGTAQELGARLSHELQRYRYRVFVEGLTWPLRCRRGHEQDEFDREDTVYVVGQGDDGRILAAARLLPTSRPYLFAKICGQLWQRGALPCSDDVWELSRFAAIDIGQRPLQLRQRLYSDAALALLDGCVLQARRLGARAILTASPPGVMRLLRRASIHHHTTGLPDRIGGEQLIGLEIACQPDRAEH